MHQNGHEALDVATIFTEWRSQLRRRFKNAELVQRANRADELIGDGADGGAV